MVLKNNSFFPLSYYFYIKKLGSIIGRIITFYIIVHLICFPKLSKHAVLPCSIRVYSRMKNSEMCGAPCIYNIFFSYNIIIHIEGCFKYDQYALKKISVMHVIKLGFAPVSFPPG